MLASENARGERRTGKNKLMKKTFNMDFPRSIAKVSDRAEAIERFF